MGTRVGGLPRAGLHCQARGHDYVVVVSRGSRRDPLRLEIYGFTVRDPLPVVSVPLRDEEPDIALDLGLVFLRTYQTGPYRKVIRYDLPPEYPLASEHASWARRILEE